MTKSKLIKMLIKEFNSNVDVIKISFNSNRIDQELYFEILDNGFGYDVILLEPKDFDFNNYIEKTDYIEKDIQLISEKIIDIENKIYKLFIGEDITDEIENDPIESFFK